MMSGRRRGMALPMVLVTLLLGAVLVYVTFDVVSNLFSSSENVVNYVQLYNAAQDGIEKGKVWIFQACDDDAKLPRWESGNQLGNLVKADLDDGYDVLLVKKLNDSGVTGRTYPDGKDVAYWTYSSGSIEVEVKIYDMGYGADLSDSEKKDVYNEWDKFPPQLIYEASGGETSARMTSTYSGSNRGEGSTGENGDVNLGYYLIRSKASFEDKDKEIEEAMIIRL